MIGTILLAVAIGLPFEKPVETGSFLATGRRAPTHQAKAALTWQTDGLEIVLTRQFEKGKPPKSCGTREHPETMFGGVGEALEIFLAPHPETPDVLYQLAVNPSNVLYQAQGMNAAWRPAKPIRSASIVGADTWQAKVFIPFGAFGERPVAKGSRWRANFASFRVNWCGISFYHNPFDYGELVFGGDFPRVDPELSTAVAKDATLLELDRYYYPKGSHPEDVVKALYPDATVKAWPLSDREWGVSISTGAVEVVTQLEIGDDPSVNAEGPFYHVSGSIDIGSQLKLLGVLKGSGYDRKLKGYVYDTTKPACGAFDVLSTRAKNAHEFNRFAYEAQIPVFTQKGSAGEIVREPSAPNFYANHYRQLKAKFPELTFSLHLDYLGEIREFAAACDVLEVTFPGTSYSAEPLPDLPGAFDYVRHFVGDKPIVFWIGGALPARGAHRTAEEMNTAIRYSILRGAVGNIFHLGHGGIPTSRTRLWNFLHHAEKHVNGWYADWVGATKTDLGLTGEDGIVAEARRTLTGETLLLAVNLSGTKKSFQFTQPQTHQNETILLPPRGSVLKILPADGWKLMSGVDVKEIISQTEVRHLPVVLVGDANEQSAFVRSEPFRTVGHPVYLLPSNKEADIRELALRLVKKYGLKPKFEVMGPACRPAAAVYQKACKDGEDLFTWIHAVNTPDGFTSEDLITAPTTIRAPRAFARRTVHPVEISKNAAGNWLVDFGREAFGWVEAETPLALDVLVGEKLTEGRGVDVIPNSAIRSARAVASAGAGWKRLILKTEIFSRGRCLSIPKKLGEIIPMRYVEIPAGAFEPTRTNMRMIALEYPYDESESGFFSSDRKLDRVYDFCKYSLRMCTFAGLYIDGDRERLPYEADSLVTQLSNFAMTSDYDVSRATCDYLMPYPTWPTEYRQISVLLNWNHWMWSGETALVKKHYDQLKTEKMMERYRREADGLLETGGEMFHGAYEGAADIVDWPPLERMGFEFRKVNAVVNAYYYIGLKEMAQMAKLLGKKTDFVIYSARANVVKDSFQKAFFDDERGVYVDGEGAEHVSIHANALAVVAGLVPEEKLAGVGNWLAAQEMNCSVYFAQHFLEALFKTGHGARAIELMTAENDRSWIGMLNAGATLTKESWNESVKANIDWNHSWGAAALNVIARCLAGVTPAEPGFETIRVAPDPAGLNSFQTKVPTAKGPVLVRYARTGVKEHLVVTVPSKATITFRGETRTVGAGTHTFGAGGALESFCVAYYPEWLDDASWARDLKLMKELGFNMVRIGEFNWGRFEPEEGVFDFAQFKRFVQLAAKEKIDVLMCTPTAATPKWMATDYPETEKTRADGTKPPAGVRQTSCLTCKKFHEFSHRITEKMAEAFKDEPAVVAWQLDNELSLAAATGECVCEECQEGFREYLKATYGSLENLNRCWNCVFWSGDYTDWDQITVPIYHLHHHNWKFDYKRFQSEQMEALMHDQKEVLRKANPNWRITTNNPGFGEGQRIDRVFRDLGYASTDRYAHLPHRSLVRWMYGVFRAVTGHEKHFMVGESGFRGGSADRTDAFGLVRAWYWEAIAQGAETFSYFLWCPSVSGEDTHAAVVPWSGQPGFIYKMLKKNMGEAWRFGEALARTPIPETPVALLYDPDASDYHI